MAEVVINIMHGKIVKKILLRQVSLVIHMVELLIRLIAVSILNIMIVVQ